MVLVVHFESEIDRLVYQLFGLTNEKPTVAVCYPCKTLINSLMPTVAIRDTSHDIRALPHDMKKSYSMNTWDRSAFHSIKGWGGLIHF